MPSRGRWLPSKPYDRTPHRVVGSPYHRNSAGILDSHAIFTAPDDAEARRLMAARSIDLVAVCGQPKVAAFFEGETDGPSFHRRLREGAQPAWLRPLDFPAGTNSAFRVFAVVK